MSNLVTWTGFEGRQYQFQLDAIGMAYKPRGGVYIFCRQEAPGQWRALYVGETADFDERLNTGLARHEGARRAMQMGATHICTLHVPAPETHRLSIETELRAALQPPANLQSSGILGW